jgi:hypothetical protein
MAARLSRSLLSLVVLLTVAALLLGWSLWQQSRRDQASSQLAITATQDALGSSSVEPLRAIAHPELLAEMGSSGLEGYLAYIGRRLGPLQSLTAISGSSRGGWIPGLGEQASASYTISLEFAEQDATATLELQQVAGDWLIRAFRVDAEALDQ